jgi:hypothetical protein
LTHFAIELRGSFWVERAWTFGAGSEIAAKEETRIDVFK